MALGELFFVKRSSSHVSWSDESQTAKKIQKKKANHPEVSDTFVFANHADRFILINALDQ